jgi:hypothetical protein
VVHNKADQNTTDVEDRMSQAVENINQLAEIPGVAQDSR